MQNTATKMLKWLNETLLSSRTSFTREASFKWFVVITIGLMIGQEHIGVTSFIRELWLDPKHYYAILHFFRSAAWNLNILCGWWLQSKRQIPPDTNDCGKQEKHPSKT